MASDVSDIRIAPKKSGGDWIIRDYWNLDLNDERDWQTAVDIFESRIYSRFIEPANLLRESKYSGFAIIALDCLLIETLKQTIEGKDDTAHGQGASFFKEFLTHDTDFKKYFVDSALARMFRNHIRNGILHKAETKENSLIVNSLKEVFVVKYTDDRNGIIINRNSFHDVLVQVFNNFIAEIRKNDPPNNLLRDRFRVKMDFICRKKSKK